MLRALFIFCLLLAPGPAPSSRPGGEITPPARRDVPGQRLQLSAGELFMPDFFAPDALQPTQLVIWSLGAAWCAEQSFYDARKNAALLTLNSAAIKAGFADGARFPALLDEASAAIARQFPGARPVGRVCLASFSGGYTAVRDILRHEELLPLINDVVLCDSLYAPKVPGKPNELEADAMAPFLNFARRAADGQVIFLFSHLYPPEEQYRGNTTTLAASYLIDHLGVPRLPATGVNSASAMLLYRADRKNFHIFGYAGMTNQDHFNHFYGSADLLRQTSLKEP